MMQFIRNLFSFLIFSFIISGCAHQPSDYTKYGNTTDREILYDWQNCMDYVRNNGYKSPPYANQSQTTINKALVNGTSDNITNMLFLRSDVNDCMKSRGYVLKNNN